MPAQAISRQLFTIPSQHFEHISRAVSAFTVDPMKSGLYYFFPIVGAWVSSYRAVVDDISQEAMMPPARSQLILREIQNMTTQARTCANTYIALNHHFSSYGGSYSLTTPVLCIPHQCLFRQNAPAFGEGYAGTPNTFSDDEVRFFIARELAQIGENNSLLRIAVKMATVAVFFFVYTGSLGWIGMPIMSAAVLAYIISERLLQKRSDLKALPILQRCGVNIPKQIAIDALEKIRAQNLLFRNQSHFANWYITASGDNRLDILNPAISSRISLLTSS